MTLTLEISEELYQALQELASRQGQSAEVLGGTWLSATVERVANDPLMRLAGSFDSGVPDLAARHDHYINRHLTEELADHEA